MEDDILEIIFLDDDKYTVLDRQMVKYGSKVKYKGKTPVKEPTSQETYTFIGWVGEEKLEKATENLVLVAKYHVDIKNTVKNAMFNASLESAKKSNLNETLEAGKKVDAQQKALAKDSRTTSEIVNEVMKNGKTEIGQDINRDNIEK